jgi:hypothetical protein
MGYYDEEDMPGAAMAYGNRTIQPGYGGDVAFRGYGMQDPITQTMQAMQQGVNQNAAREGQNMADSAMRPTHPVLQAEGKVRALTGALTQGGAAPAQFDDLVKGFADQAQKSRFGIDQKDRNNLKTWQDLAGMLQRSDRSDIDAWAQALNYQKVMQGFDAQQSQDPTLAARAGRQSYLNKHGVYEYGSSPDGNYKALDSWEAIAADKARERDQFKQQMLQTGLAGLGAHQRAYNQTMETQDQLRAMQAMQAGQEYQSNQGKLAMQPRMLDLDLQNKQAELANKEASTRNIGNTRGALINTIGALAKNGMTDEARAMLQMYGISAPDAKEKGGEGIGGWLKKMFTGGQPTADSGTAAAEPGLESVAPPKAAIDYAMANPTDEVRKQWATKFPGINFPARAAAKKK